MTTDTDRTLRDFDFAYDDIKALVQTLSDDLETANEENYCLKEEVETLTSDLEDYGSSINRLEAEVERLKQESTG